MIIKSARFVISNTDFRKCPGPELPEYAFIGRSNVGKSSLINMLTGTKNLAKISGTPGKTRLINHFIINDSWYLVDLPGYGFARISKEVRQKWEKMIDDYLLSRPNLKSTFILLDARLEPQKADMAFINWFGTQGLPFALLFTKSDKISNNQLSNNLANYRDYLLKDWEELPVSIVTSSKTGRGKEEILSLIEEMSHV